MRVGGLLRMAGLVVGGLIGWYVGALVGFVTAIFVSIIGSAAGLYAAQRFIISYLE